MKLKCTGSRVFAYNPPFRWNRLIDYNSALELVLFKTGLKTVLYKDAFRCKCDFNNTDTVSSVNVVTF